MISYTNLNTPKFITSTHPSLNSPVDPSLDPLTQRFTNCCCTCNFPNDCTNSLSSLCNNCNDTSYHPYLYRFFYTCFAFLKKLLLFLFIISFFLGFSWSMIYIINIYYSSFLPSNDTDTHHHHKNYTIIN